MRSVNSAAQNVEIREACVIPGARVVVSGGRRSSPQATRQKLGAWIDEDEARRWLGAEQFRRAPLEASGDSMLEHLGEITHVD
jgi:hypothetical protein